MSRREGVGDGLAEAVGVPVGVRLDVEDREGDCVLSKCGRGSGGWGRGGGVRRTLGDTGGVRGKGQATEGHKNAAKGKGKTVRGWRHQCHKAPAWGGGIVVWRGVDSDCEKLLENYGKIAIL